MTRKEQIKILDDKILILINIESNINQYKIDRLNAEISAFSSGDLNKYEFLTRKDLNYKPNSLDKVRFEFSPLGRAFNEELDETVVNCQEEGVIKLLKGIRDNLAGGISIPAGLIIPPGPPEAPGPPGAPGATGPSEAPPRPPVSGKLDDIDKLINDNNKKINHLINDIKNKKSKDLIDKKLNDLVNNIGNKKPEESADKDLYLFRKNLRDLVIKSNQINETDQIDFDELYELIKAKIAVSELKSPNPEKKIDWSINSSPNIPIKPIKPIKPFDLIKQITQGTQDKNYSGKECAKRVKELEIENLNDDINNLNIKLKDKNLIFDEYKIINDSINNMKLAIIKKNKNYMVQKKELELIKQNL